MGYVIESDPATPLRSAQDDGVREHLTQDDGVGEHLTQNDGGMAVSLHSTTGDEPLMTSREVEHRTGEFYVLLQVRVFVEQTLRTFACIHNEWRILDDAQQLQPGLAARLCVTEHVAGTTQLEVGLCDLGTIKRMLDHIEAL